MYLGAQRDGNLTGLASVATNIWGEEPVGFNTLSISFEMRGCIFYNNKLGLRRSPSFIW